MREPRRSSNACLSCPEDRCSALGTDHLSPAVVARSGELGWFDALKGATGVVNLAGARASLLSALSSVWLRHWRI